MNWLILLLLVGVFVEGLLRHRLLLQIYDELQCLKREGMKPRGQGKLRRLR